MYGTVARARVKQGRLDDVIALMQEWDRDFAPKIKGAKAGYLYRLDADPNAVIMVAIFEDKASYTANADNPEQDKWFRRLRDNLEADPEWSDGEIVHASS